MGSESIKVPMPLDNGFLGRECPVRACLGYFKITPGTGLQGESRCYCPYCGHRGESKTFFTRDQLAYLRSAAVNFAKDLIERHLRKSGFGRSFSTGGSFGIRATFTFKARHHPLRYYREKEVETEVICDRCTLRYAIYGVFAYCPDCGVHNSLQILNKNLALYEKLLTATEQMEADVADHFVGNALEDAVSAFDGFGRETCRIRGLDRSFQNLPGAQRKLQEHFGIDLAAAVKPEEWEFACRCFQKRHVISHKMGVIDQAYIDETEDRTAVVGRKVSVKRDEVASLISLLRKVGEHLVSKLPKP